MLKILSTYIYLKYIYKMQHLEGSGTPVLYIGRTALKVKGREYKKETAKKGNIKGTN
jgi:hypothetical protein